MSALYATHTAPHMAPHVPTRCPDVFGIERGYWWLHIPTGERGRRIARFDSAADYASKLLTWNRLGAGTWQYWESLHGDRA